MDLDALRKMFAATQTGSTPKSKPESSTPKPEKAEQQPMGRFNLEEMRKLLISSGTKSTPRTTTKKKNPDTEAKRKVKQKELREGGRKAAQTDWVEPYRHGDIRQPPPMLILPARSSKPYPTDLKTSLDPRQPPIYTAHGRPRDVLAYIERVMNEPNVQFGGSSVMLPSEVGLDVYEFMPTNKLYEELHLAWSTMRAILRRGEIPFEPPVDQRAKGWLGRCNHIANLLESRGEPEEKIIDQLRKMK